MYKYDNISTNDFLRLFSELPAESIMIKQYLLSLKCTLLNSYVRGGVNYFKLANMKTLLKEFDQYYRRRIRMVYWKSWKRIRTKFRYLRKLGLDESKAWEYANTRKSYWRIANSPILKRSLNNQKLKEIGYIFFYDYYLKATVN